MKANAHQLTSAQQERVTSCIRLATLLAFKHSKGRMHTYSDARAVAFLAVCEAARYWSPFGGAKFSTYVAPVIVQRLTCYRRHGGDVARKSGERAARRVNLSEPKIACRIASDGDSPETQASASESDALVRQSVLGEARNDRERAIASRRLLADPPETLREIAATFAISKQRLEQVEKRFLARVRDVLVSRGAA